MLTARQANQINPPAFLGKDVGSMLGITIHIGKYNVVLVFKKARH